MKCDECEARATHGTTDAVQTPEGWTETIEQRYGCAAHPVVAHAILLDGRSIPVTEYEKELCAVQTS